MLKSQPSTIIVIPAKDEAFTIGDVLDDVRKCCDYPVIVVDDGSNDDTAKIARRHGAIVLSHVINMGAWRATQTGLRYALRHGYKAVITMDADGQHRASSIAELMSAFDDNTDLVIGSCMERGSAGRHVAWRVFKWLSAVTVDDLTSGFRVYGERTLAVLVSRQATMLEYQDIGVLLLARHMKLNKKEIKVRMNTRQDGISRIFYSWRAVYKYLVYTFILTITKTLPMNNRYFDKVIQDSQVD